jgi:hypothetical protein
MRGRVARPGVSALALAALLALAGVALAADVACDASSGSACDPASAAARFAGDADASSSSDADVASLASRVSPPGGLPAPTGDASADAAALRAALEAALEEIERLRASSAADPWAPPWISRRVAAASRESRAFARFALALLRDGLAAVGALEPADAAYAALAERVLDPASARLAALRKGASATLADASDLLRERSAKAANNVRVLIDEFRKAREARREHERRHGITSPERERRESERRAYSADYWTRQRERAGHLFADAGSAASAGTSAVAERVSGAKRFAAAKTDDAKRLWLAAYRVRVLPAWARARLAVAEKAAPLVEGALARDAALVARVVARAAIVFSRVTFFPTVLDALHLFEAAEAAAADAGGPGSPPLDVAARALIALTAEDGARTLALFVADALLFVLLAMGVSSSLYFAAFRRHPADAIPDDASFEVKPIPADDGTIRGAAFGGGVSVAITLPRVTRAAECDIRVNDAEVRVKALDGFHDVRCAVPREARGDAWRDGVDRWVAEARFDVKKERLTVTLRTPAKAMRDATSAELALEEGEIPAKDIPKAEERKSTIPALGAASRKKPFSPVAPDADAKTKSKSAKPEKPGGGKKKTSSPEKEKAKAAVKAALDKARAKKKRQAAEE